MRTTRKTSPQLKSDSMVQCLEGRWSLVITFLRGGDCSWWLHCAMLTWYTKQIPAPWTPKTWDKHKKNVIPQEGATAHTFPNTRAPVLAFFFFASMLQWSYQFETFLWGIPLVKSVLKQTTHNWNFLFVKKSQWWYIENKTKLFFMSKTSVYSASSCIKFKTQAGTPPIYYYLIWYN